MTSPEKNPSDPLSGTGTTQMQGTSQTQRGTEATQRGGHLSEHARRKAGELAGDLKRQAEESAEDIRQRARSAVDEQKRPRSAGSKASQMRCVARRMIYANGVSPWPPSIRAKSPTASRAWRTGWPGETSMMLEEASRASRANGPWPLSAARWSPGSRLPAL